jgi:beta-glucosidase
MKHTKLFLCCLFLSATNLATTAKNTPIYKDPSQQIELRINDLLARMTLQEKILQITQSSAGSNDVPQNRLEVAKKSNPQLGSFIYGNENAILRNMIQKDAVENTRLGIPVLFGCDIIHGYRAVYSIPLGIGCSWNTELYQQACRIAARESRLSGVDWTFSPMIDVARDPRWGRIAEGYGEDPYTNARFAEAAVRGFQGDTLSGPFNIAACLKHYVAYGASEAGRDYVYAEVSDQTLWDTYLPPYEAGVKAGAASIMSSFNLISGVPGSANPYTLTEVLRNQWKWDGLVVADYAAVDQLVNQHVAPNRKEASKLALESGVNLDMCDNCYPENLESLVKEGKLSVATIDNAVKNILRLKFRLGLFEKPYTKELPEKERVMKQDALDIVRNLAEETFVLLKNEQNILPLSKNKKIALIGPLADDKGNLLGCWSGHGHADDVVSILSGMKQEFGSQNVSYTKGCDLDGNDSTGFGAALQAVQEADIAVVCLGERSSWTGESASRSDIVLPALQINLLKAIQRTGKPVVLLLSNGRPLALTDIVPLCSAVLEIWQPGIQAGTAVARTLSGANNPSGKLDVTFPRCVGQIPIYYDRRNPARTGDMGLYQDISSDPMYEFGYGLSYSHFSIGDLKSSATTITANNSFVVEINVTNNGPFDGKEVAQWFVSAKADKIARPIRELKFFDKQMFKNGETKTFRWTVNPLRDLGYVDGKGHHFLSPGEYTISVLGKNIPITVLP